LPRIINNTFTESSRETSIQLSLGELPTAKLQVKDFKNWSQIKRTCYFDTAIFEIQFKSVVGLSNTSNDDKKGRKKTKRQCAQIRFSSSL